MDKITSQHEKLRVEVYKYIKCCGEEERDDVFATSPLDRTSTRLEMQLWRLLLVIR